MVSNLNPDYGFTANHPIGQFKTPTVTVGVSIQTPHLGASKLAGDFAEITIYLPSPRIRAVGPAIGPTAGSTPVERRLAGAIARGELPASTGGNLLKLFVRDQPFFHRRFRRFSSRLRRNRRQTSRLIALVGSGILDSLLR